MKRLLLLTLFCLLGAMPARADTDAIEIYFLPMQEAADAAASQLSDTGRVAVIESRRMLVVDDDKAHLEKVRALLKKIDKAVRQYTAHLEIEDVSSQKARRAMASGAVSVGKLPGGWASVSLSSHNSFNSDMRRFQLRVSGNAPANIEAGVIQPVSQDVMLWLSGYGLVPANSVEMIPITSGFRVQAWPAGADSVRVRITPWMQRQQPQASGRQEMLIDLGTANNPNLAPGNNAQMRLNAAPKMARQPVIEISGAATEVTIPLDKEVTIAAMDSEAGRLSAAMMDNESTVGDRSFAIRLRVSQE